MGRSYQTVVEERLVPEGIRAGGDGVFPMMDHPEDQQPDKRDFVPEERIDSDPQSEKADRSQVGPFSSFNTIRLRLKSHDSHVPSDRSEPPVASSHPRIRLLVAGLAAFAAWGIAMIVLWQNVRMDHRPEPSDAVVRVLQTLTNESERLHARLLAPWQSYRFPGETPAEPHLPESLFGPEEMAFLDTYIAAHPEEHSSNSEGESLPGMPDRSDEPTEESGTTETSEPGRTELERMSSEAKRLVSEIMRYRLEGNAELERALSRYPDDSEAMLLLANYFRSFSQPMEASRAGQLALDLLKPVSQEATAMSDGVKPISDEDRNSLLRSKIWTVLGHILMETDQPETAVALFRQCDQLERSLGGTATDTTLLNLAESQLASNDPAGARESLASLLADHPRYLPALALRGQAWFREGDMAAAMDDFQTVTQRAPDQPEAMVAWLGMALCAAHQDDPKTVTTAMNAFRKLREQTDLPVYAPQDETSEMPVTFPHTSPTEDVCREELHQVRKKLALILVQLAALYARNDLLQTDRLLRRAMEVDDRCEAAYLLMSTIFTRQGLVEDAIRTLETGNRRTESGLLAFELAGLYRQQDRMDDSGTWLQRATERSPRTARYHAALAAWYLDRFKTPSQRTRQTADAAVLQATTAVELDPTAAHYMLLAATAATARDTQLARTAVTQALQMEPENVNYQKFLDELTAASDTNAP